MPNELFKDQPADQQDDKSLEPTDQSTLFHVGEGKKYGSIEELDKAYGHANEHIGKLESELEELRNQFNTISEKSNVADKILEALGKGKDQEDQPDDSAKQEESIEDIVQKMLEQREAQKARQTNAQRVRDALTKQFGSRAQEVYTKKAEELGVDLDELTEKSADAVLALFRSEAPTQNKEVPLSGVDTSTFQTRKEDDPLTKAYKEGKISRDAYFRAQWKEALKNQ